jgi:hypothetical protein
MDDHDAFKTGVKGSERVKRLCFLKENVPLSLPATKFTQTRKMDRSSTGANIVEIAGCGKNRRNR